GAGLPRFSYIQDGSFEIYPSPFWIPAPGGWTQVNISNEGISGGYGSYAFRSSVGGGQLTQELNSDDLYFTLLEFQVYLDGNDSTILSVIFTYEHNTKEEQIDINVSNPNIWNYNYIEVGIREPNEIIFVKQDSGSDVLLDNVQFTAGAYYKNFHLLGTNKRSRDLASLVIYGSRVSLIVSIGAIIISLIIGLPLGLAAGYFRGRIDELIMRITDIFLTLPFYFVMIMVIVVLQDFPALDNLILRLGISAEVILVAVTVGLGIFGWMGIARLVRATIFQVREMDYVEAARALGASNKRIMVIHILPNILAPLIVVVTYALAVNIIAEAGLAFLGFTDESLASWGRELNDGIEVVAVAWWPVLFPTLFIIIAVMAFNLLGDGLRDAFDPRIR
ncbi:MAG: ABC transporter permease, partial [Candidatus Hodarchaeota archaeon]